MQYPQHNKLIKRYEDHQFLMVFMQWLESQGFRIVTDDGGASLFPRTVSSSDLVSQFYDIDPVELEKEKQAMLEDRRVKE
jgi:hypothetical protein